MNADEVFNAARDAVKQMFAANGTDYRFSYDQIWKYVTPSLDVPSGQRPGPTRRLIREGYIRKNGSMRNAASSARAGSLTPEYQFGTALVGDQTAKCQTKLIDSLKDGRTGCISLLATMSVEEYLNFVENPYYEREGGIEGQRTALRTNTAIRIRKTMVSDLEAGTILPPVVVGLVMKQNYLASASTLSEQEFKDLLDDVEEENISVIDGMQRTAALISLRDKPNVLRRKMRVEFWLASNTNSLIYRMLVLNTGQVPWDLRRQIEVIHTSLIKELKEKVPSIEILEKDDQRRRVKPAQFQADRIVELYMVFGARKEKIDTKERLADEFTRLDFIEATSVSLFTVQFFRVLEILTKLDCAFDKYFGGVEVDGRFSSGRDLFSSQPACVGFIAAVAIDVFGRPGAGERPTSQQEVNLKRIIEQSHQLADRLIVMPEPEIAHFLDFATLNEVVVMDKKASKFGDFQREFFLKAFQTLIEEKFSVESMTPCWRAF
ncbi:MAG: hypothetical protein P4M11_12640 [Candidatus Pacebacteria bacterium]|nr:hypothetical protein [Candidatus Paceibacterota bacterium]